MLRLQTEPAGATVLIEWALLLSTVMAISIYTFSAPYRFPYITEFLSDHYYSYDSSLQIIIISISAFFLIWLLMNILLTLGVRKEHRSLCKIWYIANIIYIALLVLAFVFTLSFNILYIVIKALIIAHRVYAVNTIMIYCEILRISNNNTLTLFTPNGVDSSSKLPADSRMETPDPEFVSVQL